MKYSLSFGFKPNKIALLLSTILSASSLPVYAEAERISITDSVSVDKRTVQVADGADVSYIGVGATGASVTVNGKIDMVSPAGNTGSSVYVSVGDLDLGKGSSIDYSTLSSSVADAVRVYGGSLKAEDLTIKQSGVPTIGLYLNNAANVVLTGDTLFDLTITTPVTVSSSIMSSAIVAYKDSTLTAENITVKYADNKSSSEVGTTTVEALELEGLSTRITGNVNVDLQSTSAVYLEGMNVSSNADIMGTTQIKITTDAAEDGVKGLVLEDHRDSISLPARANIINFNDVNIDVTDNATDYDFGLITGLSSLGALSDITMDNLNIKARAKGDATVIGALFHGSEEASVSINNLNIAVSGDDTTNLYGIQGVSVEDMTFNTLNVQSEGGNRVELVRNANAKILGDVTLGSLQGVQSAQGNLLAIYGSIDISNNNKFQAWGDIQSESNHIVNINTGDNSYLYGKTKKVSSGILDLAFNGSHSRWDMTGDSSLTNLTLNNATLNFMAPVTSTSQLTRAATTFKTLTVSGDYTGTNGNIVMNSQLGDDTSPTDRLVIAGNTSGTTNVKVLNAGGAGGLTTEGIELISVGGNSDGEFTQSGRIIAGAYDYTLQRGEGTQAKNWFLSSALSPEPPEQPDPVVPVTPVDPVDPVDPQDPVQPQSPTPTPREHAVRPEAGLYGMNLQAANTMFNTRLQDRLGETHYVDALTGEQKVTSLWLRNVGGHTRQHDSSDQLNLQANRYVMQLGGDLAQWSSDNTDRYHLGVMAGYANQKARAENQRNGNRARSAIDGYSVGLYGTWLQDNATHEGAYVDTWAQYSWFDNTLSGDGVESEEYDAKGFTASVEAGYTWKLADISERNALYIQPKAQVTWMGVKADEHKEVNGTRVEGNGDGNVQTRVGVRLFGKGHNSLDDGKNRTFQPFVEANWIHNSKDFGVSMNGENVDLKGARNIGEVKAGVEGQLTKNVALWGNVAQQVGNNGYSDTSAMIGIKATF
ncbi:autotransporter outer membrane beta-barrel domain-containing protein [Citrobacter farmeri]|uniref:autotransporter outer membrane beta-barrel domain-containing protein n=1 Tax=Citrobacter farmeri TaxID=67824 RepID=UPI001905990E|nr:autotransporter outer membrane beta-barrel domain-containing protein [Citrobacter farmeri]MBJ9165061.1 autotransporter outer membrane beta-barrel domain-containing protein [Citrobacter farmeri]